MSMISERASIILRTCESSTIDLEAVEVSGLVEILAKNSSNDVCRHELYLDKELLVTTIGRPIVFFQLRICHKYNSIFKYRFVKECS